MLSGSIQGQVWCDLNDNGFKDAGDPGLDGWTVYLDENENGQLDSSLSGIEPDDYPDGDEMANLPHGVTLRAVGAGSEAVYAAYCPPDVPMGDHIFGHNPDYRWRSGEHLRIDFAASAYSVSIEFASLEPGSGRLEIFDSNDQPLGYDEDDSQGPDDVQSLFVENPDGDIAYAIARGVGSYVVLDNLQFELDEMSAVTDANGDYLFAELPAGQYTVAQVLEEGWPDLSGPHSLFLDDGEALGGVDFRNHRAPSEIRGRKWNDLDEDGFQDPDEPGLEGWTIYLDQNADGLFSGQHVHVEPGDYPDGVRLNSLVSGATLSYVGPEPQEIYSASSPFGGKVFAHNSDYLWRGGERLRIDFEAPVCLVSIGFTSDDGSSGRLEVYDSEDRLIDFYVTELLSPGGPELMFLERSACDIAYAIVGANSGGAGALDGLMFEGNETSAVTSAAGDYVFTNLPSGAHLVSEVVQDGWRQTFPYSQPPSSSSELIRNGGFETGGFHDWTAVTNGLEEFEPWNVRSSGGPMGVSPRSGLYDASNGFDGAAGLTYELYQDVTIPHDSVAILTTNHRIVHDVDPNSQARLFDISIRDPNSNEILDRLYSESVVGIGQYVDLGWNKQVFNVSAFAGQDVRVHFRQYVPQRDTGQASFEYDDISLTAGPADGTHLVMLDYEQIADDLNFGNAELPPGRIQGRKWSDWNANGIQDGGEPGLEGWTIFVDENGNGVLDPGGSVEPDDYDEGVELNNIIPGAVLSAIGVGSETVTSKYAPALASTGERVFEHNLGYLWESGQQLRIDFTQAVDSVSIDSTSESSGRGRLQIFDAADNLLDTYSMVFPVSGQPETMSLDRPEGDIAYAIASRFIGAAVAFDNLHFGQDEPSAVTDSNGYYELTDIPVGQRSVAEVLPDGWRQTYPEASERFFVLQDQTMREFDPINGVELNSFPSPGESGGPSGLAYGDGRLFLVGHHGSMQRLLELNPDMGAIIDVSSITTPRDLEIFSGLAYIDGLLYLNVSENNEIIVRNPDAGVVDTFEISADIVGGLTASPERDVLLATTADGSIIAIDTDNGDIVYILESETNEVVEGMAWYRGDLYRSDGSAVSRIDADTGQHIGGFYAGDYILGIGAGLDAYPSVHTVDVISDQTVWNVDFGNYEMPRGEIRGTKWDDLNGDGIRDHDEPGLEGWTIFLDENQNGVLDQGPPIMLEPDEYGENAELNTVIPGVTLSAIGATTDRVYARADEFYAPGAGGVFCHNPGSDWDESYQLRMDFTEMVSEVSIVYISWYENGFGQLEVYDADDNLLEAYVTDPLAPKQAAPMFVTRDIPDVSYAIASGQGDRTGSLDHLIFRGSMERSTVTDAIGEYVFDDLPNGTHTVAELMQDGWRQTSPGFHPDQGFEPPEQLLDHQVWGIVYGDFDRDGATDLATVHSNQYVEILLSRQDGSFEITPLYTPGNPSGLTVGDFDGDESLDLAVVVSDTDSIAVMLNDGSGVFNHYRSYGGVDRADQLVSGDFDGDDDADLAVLESNDISHIRILLNEGDGSFLSGPAFSTQGFMRQIAIADLDEDGDQDLAANNSGYWSGSVPINQGAWVFMNNGDATFEPGVHYDSAGAVEGVAIGDLDGDDDADLVLPNRETDAIEVFLNNGDGTFAASRAFPAGDGPIYVTLGDIDGDGDPDIAGKNKYDQDVWYMLNDSTGSFGDAIIPEGPWDSHFGTPLLIDTNGLGYSDLYVADDYGLWRMENPQPVWDVVITSGQVVEDVDFGNATIPGPRVIRSSVHEGDQFSSNGSLIVEVEFDRAIEQSTLDETDFEMLAQLHGPQIAESWSYDPVAKTLTLTYRHLPDDQYILTLFSENGRFEAPFGANLDGETPLWPIPPFASGDGVAGGDFVVNFSYDITFGPAADFERLRPLGSLVLVARDGGYVNFASDRDVFELNLSKGETMSTVAVGDLPAASLTLELFGAAGVLGVATGTGTVALDSVSIPDDGVYLLRLTGDTPTAYNLDFYRNAAVELSDTDDGSEMDITASYLDLGSGRFAVVGQIDTSETDEFLVDLTGRTGESIDIVLGVPDESFSGRMNLLDSSGTVLATSTEDPLGTDVTNYEHGILDFVVPADGIYTIRLDSEPEQQASQYVIVVTEDLVFDTEPNDSAPGSRVRPLGDVNGAMGFVNPLPVAIRTLNDGRVVSLRESQYIAKLSEEQLQAAILDGYIRERVRFNPPRYDPGHNPNRYWLLFEDWWAPNSDMDFEDVRILVEETSDTRVDLDVFIGHTYMTHSLVHLSGEVLIPVIDQNSHHIQIDTDFGVDESDRYYVDLQVGQALMVSTQTPGDGPMGWGNAMDPMVEIYGPGGDLWTSGDNSAVDGRNVAITRIVYKAGSYEIRVGSAAGSSGEYVLDVTTHSPTVENAIPDITVDEDAAATVLDLSGVFADDDPMHNLTLSVASNTDWSMVSPAIDGTSLTLSYAPDANGTADITVRSRDSLGAWVDDTFTVTINPVPDVVERGVFYNNSAYGDQVDPSKIAMLAGGSPSSAYTGNINGITGIAVDIDDVPFAPTAADFGVRVHDSQSDTWQTIPTPVVNVHMDQGVGGADRMTLAWPDGSIVNQWIEITTLATANTGLPTADVFYFGNSVGDCDGDGTVGDGDLDLLIGEFGLSGAGLATDFDGDAQVTLADFAIMRHRFGETVAIPTFPAPAPLASPGPLTSVNQSTGINAPTVSPSAAQSSAPANDVAAVVAEPQTLAIDSLLLPESNAAAGPRTPERELIGALTGDASQGAVVWLDADDILVDLLAETVGSRLSVFG